MKKLTDIMQPVQKNLKQRFDALKENAKGQKFIVFDPRGRHTGKLSRLKFEGNIHGKAIKRDLIGSYEETNPRCERDELFDFFFDNLRGPYKTHTGRNLSKAYLGTKISHLKLHDLYHLKSVCVDSNNFSWTFWGKLKVKKT